MEEGIPRGYPLDLDDPQIREIADILLNRSTETIRAELRNKPPDFYTLLASVGVQELQIRNIEKLRKEIEELQKNNAKSNRWNRILSTVTIMLAAATIYVGLSTLSIAREDIQSDLTWQQSQIQELKNQTEKLEKINQSLQYQLLVNDSVPLNSNPKIK